MIILDTDHLSVLASPDNERRRRLASRMAGSNDQDFRVAIISVEEQMRGWLAAIAKERQMRRQVIAYRELGRLVGFFAHFAIVEFDDRAVSESESIRSNRVRIRTMDLKIAAICRSMSVLLLTANKRDFERVPGLQIENWLD